MDEILKLKTRKEKQDGLVLFNGNNNDPLPKELFDSIDSIYEKNKEAICKRLNSYEDYNMGYELSFDDNKYAYDDFYDTFYELEPWNTSIGLTIYYDHESKTNLFSVIIAESGRIDTEYFQNHQQFRCELTPELENYYYEWKEFKNKHKDQYNQPYERKSNQMLNNTIDSFNHIECECCLFADHCDGIFCLKP